MQHLGIKARRGAGYFQTAFYTHQVLWTLFLFFFLLRVSSTSPSFTPSRPDTPERAGGGYHRWDMCFGAFSINLQGIQGGNGACRKPMEFSAPWRQCRLLDLFDRDEAESESSREQHSTGTVQMYNFGEPALESRVIFKIIMLAEANVLLPTHGEAQSGPRNCTFGIAY